MLKPVKEYILIKIIFFWVTYLKYTYRIFYAGSSFDSKISIYLYFLQGFVNTEIFVLCIISYFGASFISWLFLNIFLFILLSRFSLKYVHRRPWVGKGVFYPSSNFETPHLPTSYFTILKIKSLDVLEYVPYSFCFS